MSTITAEPFGLTRAGEPVMRYTLENGNGMRVSVLDRGCTVQSIVVPDRTGRGVDVALGYETAADYARGRCCHGALVGRVANRIRGASFVLDGRLYTLEKNEGENHLHGVFGSRLFHAEAADDALFFRRVSPDGEEGYPGALELTVCVRLRADNALELSYEARSDAPTPVNLTNHTYFNLNGQDGSDVLDHELAVFAACYTEIDAELLPTGAVCAVADTPFDFRAMRPIGERIGQTHPQLLLAGGYDHNYIIGPDDGALRRAACVRSPRTGIRMECLTTQPAVQLYTGNFMGAADEPAGKGGVRYPRRGGFCLETQHYPDSPNLPQFPDVILRPGETYAETTVYRFDTEAER